MMSINDKLKDNLSVLANIPRVCVLGARTRPPPRGRPTLSAYYQLTTYTDPDTSNRAEQISLIDAVAADFSYERRIPVVCRGHCHSCTNPAHFPHVQRPAGCRCTRDFAGCNQLGLALHVYPTSLWVEQWVCVKPVHDVRAIRRAQSALEGARGGRGCRR